MALLLLDECRRVGYVDRLDGRDGGLWCVLDGNVNIDDRRPECSGRASIASGFSHGVSDIVDNAPL